MIDEQYLFNFSEDEKKALKAQMIQIEKKKVEEEKKLEYKMFICASAFDVSDYHPYTDLQLRYTINRLMRNDESLTTLELSQKDALKGDLSAFQIARALNTNTFCHTFSFQDCGLSDKGVATILHALRKRPVRKLDLRGNNLTFNVINQITKELDCQEKDASSSLWEEIWLGRVEMPFAKAKELSAKYPQLVYLRKTATAKGFFDRIFAKKEKIDFREKD